MSGIINYIKKAFKNYPDTTTPINAENLNYLDDAIYNLDQTVGEQINSLNNSISTISERVSKMGMKVLKYGTISSTTTIPLGVTLDPSKYMVDINTSAYESTPSTGTFVDYTRPADNAGYYVKGYGWSSSYGQGAYLSAKTSTSCTITVSSGITASYEIIQIAE